MEGSESAAEGGVLLSLGDVQKGFLGWAWRTQGDSAHLWEESNPNGMGGAGARGGVELCVWDPSLGGAGQATGDGGREQRGWGREAWLCGLCQGVVC